VDLTLGNGDCCAWGGKVGCYAILRTAGSAITASGLLEVLVKKEEFCDSRDDVKRLILFEVDVKGWTEGAVWCVGVCWWWRRWWEVVCDQEV